MSPQITTSSHPLVAHKLGLLRDASTDGALFRELLDELSLLLAMEATRSLPLKATRVSTPLTSTEAQTLDGQVGLVPILRAGLGMVSGFQRLLPRAQVWHLGLYRDEQTLKPVEYYNKLPSRAPVDHVIVLDPMLATGHSAIAALDVLKRWEAVSLSFVGVLAAPEGVAAFHARHPDVPVHVACVDERLTDATDAVPSGYIWPGLGDAGDRQFGTLPKPASEPVRTTKARAPRSDGEASAPA